MIPGLRPTFIRLRFLLPATCAAVLLVADRAAACTACFGDPDSPMAKGVVAGVLVLLGVVSFVLLGFVGTGLFWVQRGRRLASGEPSECRGELHSEP